LPGVHLNVNAADGRFLGLCYRIGFTSSRTGDRNITWLEAAIL